MEKFKEGTAMKEQDKAKLGRRDFLRAMGAGAGVAVTAAAPLATTAVAAESDAEKKKARYQPNSTDVQSYYKSNRYPS
jgi:H+/Cl- antiporter ClcA